MLNLQVLERVKRDECLWFLRIGTLPRSSRVGRRILVNRLFLLQAGELLLLFATLRNTVFVWGDDWRKFWAATRHAGFGYQSLVWSWLRVQFFDQLVREILLTEQILVLLNKKIASKGQLIWFQVGHFIVYQNVYHLPWTASLWLSYLSFCRDCFQTPRACSSSTWTTSQRPSRWNCFFYYDSSIATLSRFAPLPSWSLH